jgi:hypothetical protein
VGDVKLNYFLSNINAKNHVPAFCQLIYNQAIGLSITDKAAVVLKFSGSNHTVIKEACLTRFKQWHLNVECRNGYIDFLAIFEMLKTKNDEYAHGR